MNFRQYVYYSYRIPANIQLRDVLTCTVFIGFDILRAVNVRTHVFWGVTPCSLAELNQRFRII